MRSSDWSKSLKTETEKTNAVCAFDLLIETNMKFDSLTMMVSDECPIGSLPTSGILVTYSGGVVHDATVLLGNFEVIKKGLGPKSQGRLLWEMMLD